MKIYLANPRGFCAGVDRAISIVEETIKQFHDKQIYVCHEIVHNKTVIENFKQKGVQFVNSIEEVPQDSIAIFSAHGTAKKSYDYAENKNLTYVDATCPLVKKVHFSVNRHKKKNTHILFIGHKGHPEVIGTLGQLPEGEITLISTIEDVEKLNFDADTPVAYTTQTTLSQMETKEIITALKKKIPHIKGPTEGDICYATTNRQNAVLSLSEKIDVFLVIGSQNSSNSNRLKELVENQGIPSYLIDNVNDLEIEWLKDKNNIGISSGASAPESKVQELVQWLKEKFPIEEITEINTVEENVHFPLPLDLRKRKKSSSS